MAKDFEVSGRVSLGAGDMSGVQAIGTVITAFLSYRFNIFKVKSERSLKEGEAADKGRDNTIQSCRNELGLNSGLEVFSRDAQLVDQNGKIVRLEMAV